MPASSTEAATCTLRIEPVGKGRLDSARMDPLTFTQVTAAAAMVRAGELSPAELVEGSVRRIEALDGGIGAFVEVDGDRALAEARAIGRDDERPFAGVPIAIKTEVPVAGRLMTMGSRFLAAHRPGHTAYAVRRLEEAGFVVVGMTKMPELGILPTTEPREGGPARNPWDLERTPGGSSGGAAAAVAAGMVPIAHGGDGGGSLRIPAACCHLVGLKASRGRISHGPDLGDSFLATQGVLTRTVADTALALDVMAGYEAGDATWAPRPVEPYASAVARDPGRLRIAVTSANPLQTGVDPESARALQAAADALAGLGHEVVEAAPPMPGPETLGPFAGVFAPLVSLGAGYARLVNGREPTDEEMEPLTHGFVAVAERMTSTEYLATVAQLQALSRQVIAFFADHDVLMTPSLAQRPLRVGELNGSLEDPLDALARAGRFSPFTALFNVTGQPAIAVPAGIGTDGLPTSVQIVGRPLAEETLLQLARQLEELWAWHERRPEVDQLVG